MEFTWAGFQKSQIAWSFGRAGHGRLDCGCGFRRAEMGGYTESDSRIESQSDVRHRQPSRFPGPDGHGRTSAAAAIEMRGRASGPWFEIGPRHADRSCRNGRPVQMFSPVPGRFAWFLGTLSSAWIHIKLISSLDQTSLLQLQFCIFEILYLIFC